MDEKTAHKRKHHIQRQKTKTTKTEQLQQHKLREKTRGPPCVEKNSLIFHKQFLLFDRGQQLPLKRPFQELTVKLFEVYFIPVI